ncbi:putative cytochrome P450 6a17 [Haematobia irritans]|uniref:putative cytochrome P450 6a17 n=1 Tax=Haematobia irritans TaxID=7368 RepID=UPI003F50994C
MDSIVIFVILIVTIVLLICAKYTQRLSVWKHQGVESVNFWQLYKRSKTLTFGMNIGEEYQQMFTERKPFRVIELLFTSVLVVQDPQAIKDIMIKNFEHFPDRGFYVNQHEALSHNLLRIDYALWKPLRQKLSPTFSPGKLRKMFPTLEKVAKQLVTVLGDKCQADGNEAIDIYDLCACFITDVIGILIFGITCNSLQDPNAEVRRQCDRALTDNLNPFLDMVGVKFPKLLQFFNVYAYSKETNEFYKRLFMDNMEYREKNNVHHNDLMDLLIDIKNTIPQNAKEFQYTRTLDQLASQLAIFFIAGFDTTSGTLSCALYELAKNFEMQDKARKEILQTMVKYKGHITYDSLKDMKFIKAVLQETLRKYSIAPVTIRICRHPCKITTSCGSSLDIETGNIFLLPLYGIHHNPDLFPDPDKFSPERYTNQLGKENGGINDFNNILAFGAGPKICIGEHFARLQITYGLSMLLSEFEFSACPETPKELKFDIRKKHILSVSDGIRLKVDKLIKRDH